MAGDSIISGSYKHLINSSTFYLISVDLEGKFTYVNPLFSRRFSYLWKDFTGKPSADTIYEEDLPACRKATFACLENPAAVVPVRLRKPDGNGGFFWTQWEFSALCDKQGSAREILCLGYDITETEQAHRQAQDFAQKIDTIIENVTDGFFVLDKNWHIIRVNRVMEQSLGVSRSEILHKNFWDIFPGDAHHKYPEAYRTAMNDSVTVNFEDYHPQTQQWFDVTAYPSQEGLTVLFRDITDRKQKEEIIRESNNKLTAILNSTTDINILIDPEYKVLSFNQMAVESMRKFYDNKELAVGQNILEYILPGTEEDFMNNFQSALSGEPVEVKIRLSFKPGMALWFLVKYFPVYDNEQQVIGVAFNSTNIDKQQRQYEQLNDIAKLYSHEIRRPVATILGIIQLFDVEQLSLENKEWFSYLTKTTRELDRVIHQIVRKTSEIA